MKIVETYSHLNGLEFLLVHRPQLWEQVQAVIAAVDAKSCKIKVSKEVRMKGQLKYSPIEMNNLFSVLLREKEWKESRVSYLLGDTQRKTDSQHDPFAAGSPEKGNRGRR